MGGSLPPTIGINESTSSFPRRALLTKIRVVVPAATAGATAALYRLYIGNDDKSVTYASSVAGPQNAGFTINEDIAIRLGDSVANRRLRVWADNGSGLTSGAAAITPLLFQVYYTN